ncbi:probable maltase-glucoamylase 2 [Acidimicrobiaceae bacterium]|nr:probable maltase-glucoamylase 2 [Acidimicrobiaceae bacterium]
MSRKVSLFIAALMVAMFQVTPAHAASPTITGVGSPTTAGSYKVGSPIIEIRVQFSEIVNVTGIPTLELETGVTDRVLNYSSGSGTNRLVFNYTISTTTNPDTSPDLDYKATTSLALNGGTIKNGAAEDATLTLPAPGAANSLGANNAIIIDTTAPTASVTTVTVGPNGTGVTLNAVAQSNELGTLFLVKSSNSPTSRNAIMALPANERSNGTTVATINTNTNVPASMLTDGTYKIYAEDAAGNLSVASTNTVTIDAVTPFVGMVPMSTPLGNNSRISVQSSEIGTAYLVLSSIPVTTKANITGSADADFNAVTISAANTNTALLTTTLNPGNYKLYAVDAVDNLSMPFGSLITIGTDSSPPTVLNATPFTGETQAGIAANLVIRFSEPVAKFTTDSSKTISLVRSVTPTITTGSLTGNVATLTFSAAPGFVVGDKITTTSCSNAVYNNVASAITTISGSTISFAKTNADIASAAITGCAYTATKNDGTTNLITTSEIIPSDNSKVSVGSFPNDDQVTINPSGEMLFGVAYHVLISSGAIVDLATAPNIYAGVPSATPQTWSFSTGTDTIAPTLSSSQSDPPNGMTTFTPSRNITLKFSETVVDVATKLIKLCTGAVACGTPVQTFTLQSSSEVTVSGSLVTINPTADLGFSTTYFLLIEAGAFRDGSGNDYAGMATCSSHPCTYEFTTSAAPVAGAPPPSDGGGGGGAPAPTTGAAPVSCGPPPAPPCTPQIIGPAPTFGAGGVPLGNTLTAGNMGAVDPNAFRGFNPAQAGQIAPTAMAGMNSSQMAALPPSAMGGFNSSQMAALPPSAMAGFKPDQMSALPPSAMGGFNSSQMAALPPSAMAGFKPDQMSALPPSAMGGFNSSQMAALPPTAMAGFKPDQMSALPPSAMAGFKPDQMSALPPTAMAGFNQNQMAALPPSAMQGFNAKQMTQLPPTAMAGFNQNQFAQLPPSAMTNFKPDQMSALPPAAMGGFNQNQFAVLPPTAMAGFKPDQMAALPPSAMQGFNLGQMKVLPPSAMSSFKPDQFAALPPSAMISFKPDQMAALPPAAFSGMQQNQFKVIPAAAMGAFTPTQMDSMPVGALAVISPSQFKSLTPAVIASMSPEQRNALPQQALNPAANAAPVNIGNANALAGALTGWNIDKVPPNAFNNFKPADAAKLSAETFSAMNPEQFKAMPANAFAGFKPDQVGALTPQVFAGMKPTQLASMPNNAFGSFNSEQVAALPAAAFGAMKPTQVGALPPALMSTMSPEQVGALPAKAMAGLKADQVDALPPTAFAAMKPGAVGALSPAAVGSLNVDQVGAMPPAAFGAMKPNQVGALPPALMSTMSPEQVGALPAKAMAGLKADQVDALPPAAFTAMKPAVVGALSPAAVGSLNVEQVGALPAAAFGAMKPNQVGALPPAAMATMTPQQVGALPAKAISGLKADQVDALPPTAFATMKPAAVGALSPAAAAGFSNDTLAAMTPAQEKALKPAFVNKLTPEQKAALKG